MNEEIEQYLQEWGVADATIVKTYKVPVIFYDDHIDRSCGLTDKVIKRTHNQVTVELNEAGYQDLLSDADYYWEVRDEIDWRQLCDSAKRTLEALRRQGAPASKAVAA